MEPLFANNLGLRIKDFNEKVNKTVDKGIIFCPEFKFKEIAKDREVLVFAIQRNFPKCMPNLVLGTIKEPNRLKFEDIKEYLKKSQE